MGNMIFEYVEKRPKKQFNLQKMNMKKNYQLMELLFSHLDEDDSRYLFGNNKIAFYLKGNNNDDDGNDDKCTERTENVTKSMLS